MVGALGRMIGVSNVLPASHARLYQLCVVNRDHAGARRLFFELLPTLELMEGGGRYTQWVKVACGLLGRDCGPPRQPLCAADQAERAGLRRAMRACAEARPRKQVPGVRLTTLAQPAHSRRRSAEVFTDSSPATSRVVGPSKPWASSSLTTASMPAMPSPSGMSPMPQPNCFPRLGSHSSGMSFQWTCLMRGPKVLTNSSGSPPPSHELPVSRLTPTVMLHLGGQPAVEWAMPMPSTGKAGPVPPGLRRTSLEVARGQVAHLPSGPWATLRRSGRGQANKEFPIYPLAANLVLLAVVSFVDTAVGAGLVPVTKPVAYSDGRPHPSCRMDASDLAGSSNAAARPIRWTALTDAPWKSVMSLENTP